MSDPIFLTMTGEHHGLVSAGCGSKTSIGRYAHVNHQDQIFALSLLSGWGYEKQSERRCVSFHKFIDKSTPLLALGINENERYFLEFDFYRINQFGHFEKYYFIELRGASIIALQMNFDTRSGHDTECVTLAYDYIRCRHLVAATEYYHFALPANYNSLFSVQNPIVAARNAAQRSGLNSANVGRLLAAGGVYHQNPEGFKKVAEQLGGDAPKGFNQVLNEQSAGTLMAMGAMIGLGKGAASHIPSLDKVKKTQQTLTESGKQLGGKISDRVVIRNNEAYNLSNNMKLKDYYTQLEKYGAGGVKELQNGRYRFYDELTPSRILGEMNGARLVREWDPTNNRKRTWYETVDHQGNIRSVSPKPVTNNKNHHIFDANGNYKGRR